MVYEANLHFPCLSGFVSDLLGTICLMKYYSVNVAGPTGWALEDVVSSTETCNFVLGGGGLWMSFVGTDLKCASVTCSLFLFLDYFILFLFPKWIGKLSLGLVNVLLTTFSWFSLDWKIISISYSCSPSAISSLPSGRKLNEKRQSPQARFTLKDSSSGCLREIELLATFHVTGKQPRECLSVRDEASFSPWLVWWWGWLVVIDFKHSGSNSVLWS